MNKVAGLLFVSMMTSVAHANHYMGAAHLNQQKAKDVRVDGFAEVKDSEFQSLQVNGALEFENLKVEKSVTVAGAVKGEHLKTHKLEVHGGFEAEDVEVVEMRVDGSAEADSLRVRGPLNVHGSLSGEKIDVTGETLVAGGMDVEESQFAHVKVSGEKVVLDDTTVANLIIQKTNKDRPQVVILKGKTRIDGDIVFETGKGEVVQSDKATIKGQVKGGTITKKQD
ncbi:MAG: hypothetical protein ACK5O7_06460 [Holosporales bacterium]